MYQATIIVLTVVGTLILAWGGLMLWGQRNGQFRKIEEAKYLMMQEDREPDEDEKDHPCESVSTVRDTGRPPGNASYGGEVESGPGGSQPRWLRFLYLALYAFAIGYMLLYAGDRWIIRVFALALAGWAAYSLPDLFRSRHD